MTPPRALLSVFVLSSCLVHVSLSCAQEVDERAVMLARQTLDRMGGQDNWDAARYIAWDIFGQTHYWDKWTGAFRWERDSMIVIMNINEMTGRAWSSRVEMEAGQALDDLLAKTYARWINNSYWLLMPYKLLDPGVNLTYVGTEMTEDGTKAEVLELTFDEVGLTPWNKYKVYIDAESKLVCQWSYFENRSDEEPGFTRPWEEWSQHGSLWFSTGRGSERTNVTRLVIMDDMDQSIFQDAGPVSMVRE